MFLRNLKNSELTAITPRCEARCARCESRGASLRGARLEVRGAMFESCQLNKLTRRPIHLAASNHSHTRQHLHGCSSIYTLDPGTRALGPGPWDPGTGSWALGPGSWALGPGPWVLGPGTRALGPGSFVSHPRQSHTQSHTQGWV